MAQTSDPRFQTYVAAFVPLQKLLNNNAISESSYKAICAILEQELDNRPAQSEQEVISTIQMRAQAQTPPVPPPDMQGPGNMGAPQTASRDLKDDSGTLSRGYASHANVDLCTVAVMLESWESQMLCSLNLLSHLWWLL